MLQSIKLWKVRMSNFLFSPQFQYCWDVGVMMSDDQFDVKMPQWVKIHIYKMYLYIQFTEFQLKCILEAVNGTHLLFFYTYYNYKGQIID